MVMICSLGYAVLAIKVGHVCLPYTTHYTDETALDMVGECPKTNVKSDAHLRFLERRRKAAEEDPESLKVRTYPAVDAD
jgi:hypothetical protein